MSLQYLGHSCFVITTPAGVRLIIDPYSSGEWPGLALPAVHADRVLVSHPHWDHSGWRAVRGKPKVIDRPGVYKGKDLVVRGIPGRHASAGGEAIGHRNTIFVIETAGLRFCHLGDNGPIGASPEAHAAIGTVDVLMLPVDSDRRVLTYDQAREWVEALSPRIVIPMHYRVAGLSPHHVEGLGGVQEWLSAQGSHTRHPADTMAFGGDAGMALPAAGAKEVHVLTLPGETPREAAGSTSGGAEAAEAKRRGEEAVAEGDLATAIAEFTRAAALDPGDADLLQKIGFLHLAGRRPDRAYEFLSRAAGAAGPGEEAIVSLAWLGAGMALDLLGRRDEALAAYRKVVELGVNDDHQVVQARRYLETPYRED